MPPFPPSTLLWLAVCRSLKWLPHSIYLFGSGWEQMPTLQPPSLLRCLPGKLLQKQL